MQSRANVLSFIARCTEFAIIPPALLERITEACLETAIDPQLQTRKAWHFAVNPVSALESANLDSDANVITQVYERKLTTAINPPESSPQAVNFVMQYLTGIQFRSLSADAVIDQFDRAILNVGSETAVALRSSADANCRYAPVLAWHGLISTDEMARAMAEEETLIDRYFAAGPDDFVPSVASIAEWLVRSAGAKWSSHSAHQQTVIRTVSLQIVRDFETKLPPIPRPRRSFLGFTSHLNLPLAPTSVPTPVVNALLIIYMASFEMIFPAHTPKQYRKDFEFGWLDREGEPVFEALVARAAKDIANRARDWSAGDANLFAAEGQDRARDAVELTHAK